MKKYNFLIIIISLAGILSFSSCGDDFLTTSSAGKEEIGGGAADETRVLSFLGSAYQILLFDSYAGGNYNSIVLMSDLRSDDLYKGGENASDQAALYRLATFTSSGTETVMGPWTIYYPGIARCNNTIMACENAEGIEEAKLNKYKAEAHLLRAYYTHILWKVYGNIPYFTAPLEEPFLAKQYSADEIYNFIMEDLEIACRQGVLPMHATGPDLGRVSRATALMLKARVVLYQKDQARYPEVTREMAEIINSGQFSLFEDFSAMWLDENEFNKESIFETNQLPEGKTWGDSWQGYGTNLPAFISPNSLNDPAGIYNAEWGFAPVRPAAYNMYESGDLRRDASIILWPAGSYTPRFQNTGYFMHKYAARKGYNPPPGDTDLNYCNNLRIFRYAETLLNYVELVKMHGQAEQGPSAQDCFDQIRRRAFGMDKSIPATPENIKMERRREFMGEGHRFWDLVRWGDAASVLTENDVNMNSVRTFEEWKKYAPIPQTEIEKTRNTEFELKQNQGWN